MKHLIPFFAIVLLLAVSCNADCTAKQKLNCSVTFELNPICGCDGITYDNPSIAFCNNITDYTIGACQ